MTLWQHLLPPFDQWWPNIIAQMVWSTPVVTIHHLLMRRHIKNVVDKEGGA